MKRDIITSAIGILVLTLILGILYPLLMTGISQGVFPGNANGQQIKVGGKLVGSRIIGQQFADQVVKNGKPQVDKMGNPVTNPDPKYFQSRPSATVPPYAANGSTFSNLGPNNTATRDAIVANIQAYLALEKPYVPSLTAAHVPVDAVNTSGSGLDPDISQANARIQAHRIAAVRHLTLAQVYSLIDKYTHGRGLGFSGERGVDVLELNLALDRIAGGH
jgi:K+-transporting ATPase ATPase C chain